MHKVIFENKSSAIRGLEVICQYLTSGFVYNTLKQTTKQSKESERANKKKNIFLATSA